MVNIYVPPIVDKLKVVEDFDKEVEVLSNRKSPMIVTGDFKIGNFSK